MFGFSKKQLLIVVGLIFVVAKYVQSQTKAGKPLPLIG